MKAADNPEILRRRLRVALTRLREQAGMTQKDVAKELDWSAAKLLRIEHGLTFVTKNDLLALLRFYGLTTEEEDLRFVAMARLARRYSEYREYRDLVDDSFLKFLQYEESALTIRWVETVVIPGMFQTEDYARALLTTRSPLLHRDDERVERLVALRVKRQRVLHGPDPPTMHVIMDESTVRRRIGGARVMREQLAHLQKIARLPHVRMGILPFAAGVHSGVVSSFTVIEFADPQDAPVMFVDDGWRAALRTENGDEIQPFLDTVRMLDDIAVTGDGLAPFLDDAMAALPD